MKPPNHPRADAPQPENTTEQTKETSCAIDARSPACEKPGLCSVGLCPGTLLLLAFLLIQGIIALAGWLRA